MTQLGARFDRSVFKQGESVRFIMHCLRVDGFIAVLSLLLFPFIFPSLLKSNRTCLGRVSSVGKGS